MYTVTITKQGVTIETQHFAYLTMFSVWMSTKGSGWLADGCRIEIEKGTPVAEEPQPVGA